MLRTTLLNGITTEKDKDYTEAWLTTIRPGVITGLEVTTGSISAGVWFIKATRTATTPTEDVLVRVELTEAYTQDTTGTKKVWIEIDQNNLNDAGLNDASGSTAWSVQTGASYPVSGYYIPLADIVAGVITDNRKVATIKGRNLNGAEIFLESDAWGTILKLKKSDWTKAKIKADIEGDTNVNWTVTATVFVWDGSWITWLIAPPAQATQTTLVAWEDISVWDALWLKDLLISSIWSWASNQNLFVRIWQTIDVVEKNKFIDFTIYSNWSSTYWWSSRTISIYSDVLKTTLLWSSSIFISWNNSYNFIVNLNVSQYTQIFIEMDAETSYSIYTYNNLQYNAVDYISWWALYFNWIEQVWADLKIDFNLLQSNDWKVYKTKSDKTYWINFIWFANNTALTGENVLVNTAWVDNNQSGLSIWSYYHLQDIAWTIWTTPWTNEVKVWKAISGTEILIGTIENSVTITTTLWATTTTTINHLLGRIPKVITCNASLSSTNDSSYYGSNWVYINWDNKCAYSWNTTGWVTSSNLYYTRISWTVGYDIYWHISSVTETNITITHTRWGQLTKTIWLLLTLN